MLKSKLKFLFITIFSIVLTLGLSISLQSLLADWTPPRQTPPACNLTDPGCAAPVNVSTSMQIKGGWMGVGDDFDDPINSYPGNPGGPQSLLHLIETNDMIDATTPRNAELDIQSVPGNNQHWGIYHDRTSDDLRFWNNLDNAAPYNEPQNDVLTLTSQGRVGIGLTNPNNLLHVNGLVNFDNTNLTTKLGYQAGNNLVTGAISNTFVGYQAGLSGVSTNAADENTAVGSRALNSLTSGRDNTANGAFALYLNTTGSYNTADGAYSLYSNTTGGYNTAEGYSSLYANTLGSYNTVSGHFSMRNNTTGSRNVASGYYALVSNTTGGYNTANGMSALQSNTTGNYNTASGYYALNSNDVGLYNTAAGMYSLRLNTSGTRNTGNGSYALYSNTTGSNNVAEGYGSLYNNNSGTYNIGVGIYSLFANDTGTYNIGLGYMAGRYLANASANSSPDHSIYIGDGTRSATAAAGNAQNEIVIGYNAYGNGSNSVTIGNTGVLSTTLRGNTLIYGANRYLNFNSIQGSTGYGIRDNGGTIEVKNNGGSWTSLGSSVWAINANGINYNAGNVGIGTNEPNYKLEIIGDSSIQGSLYASGRIYQNNNSVSFTSRNSCPTGSFETSRGILHNAANPSYSYLCYDYNGNGGSDCWSEGLGGWASDVGDPDSMDDCMNLFAADFGFSGFASRSASVGSCSGDSSSYKFTVYSSQLDQNMRTCFYPPGGATYTSYEVVYPATTGHCTVNANCNNANYVFYVENGDPFCSLISTSYACWRGHCQRIRNYESFCWGG